MRARLLAAAGLAAFTGVVAPATIASAAGAPLYNSTVAPATTGNLPSVGAEAYAFDEFGNEVNLSGSALGKVTVELSTWGCQSGTWHSGDCATTPGTTFSEPITFNIYNAPATGADTPGSLIASVTRTFNIPYRPSANYTHCNSTNGKAGEWWDKALNSCFNGKLVKVTFPFFVNLPSANVVYGIAYNTSHYGYHPYGESTACYTSSGGCGYDSLNIALSQDPTNVSSGSDTNPGTVWQNSSLGSEYCDNGAAGTGFFRLDSPASPSCWGVSTPASPPYYIPAVELAHS